MKYLGMGKGINGLKDGDYYLMYNRGRLVAGPLRCGGIGALLYIRAGVVTNADIYGDINLTNTDIHGDINLNNPQHYIGIRSTSIVFELTDEEIHKLLIDFI